MSNKTDLIVRSPSDMIARPRTAVTEGQRYYAEVTSRFAEEQAALAAQENNLIFAVDATASRQHFWQQTSMLQNEMFRVVRSAGATLSAQLVSYSGKTHDRDVVASPWYNNMHVLSDHMSAVTCESGATQIAKVFRHALKECISRKVHALILVVDSCEEQAHELVPLARQIEQNGIKFFLFDDQERSTGRAPGTDSTFMSVVRASNGVYAPFDMDGPEVLQDYLRTVAAVTTGNRRTIGRLEREIRTPEGRRMLQKSVRLLEGPKR